MIRPRLSHATGRAPMLLMATFVLASACREAESPERHEPMRRPASGQIASEPPPAPEVDAGTETTETTESEPEEDSSPPLAERPPADPAIERAIDLIESSGHTFVDPATEEDEEPTVYSAADFAKKLRTKWDWIGYDIIEIEPWLDEIAARSFKTNLPYRVRIEGPEATVEEIELRPWLEPQLSP